MNPVAILIFATFAVAIPLFAAGTGLLRSLLGGLAAAAIMAALYLSAVALMAAH